MCPDSQIQFEKSPPLVLFSSSQPCREGTVLCATSHAVELCPYRSQHLHCTHLLGHGIFTVHGLLQPTLYCQELGGHRPSESNFCSPVPAPSPPGATFVRLDAHPQRRGEQSTPKACNWKQLARAWPLRKAGPWERDLAGFSQAAFGPASIARPPLS